MPNIGPTELIIIAFLAILFFGKDKLPEFAKSMGDSLKIFKSSLSDKPEVEEIKEHKVVESKIIKPETEDIVVTEK